MNNDEPLENVKPEKGLPEIEEQIRQLAIEAARFGIHLRREYSTMLWKDWHTEYLGFTFTLGGCDHGLMSLQISSRNHLLKQIDGCDTIIKLEREAQKFVDEIVCATYSCLMSSNAIYAALLNGWCNVPKKYVDQYFALILKVIKANENVHLLKQAIDRIDKHVADGEFSKDLQDGIAEQLRKSRISA